MVQSASTTGAIRISRFKEELSYRYSCQEDTSVIVAEVLSAVPQQGNRQGGVAEQLVALHGRQGAGTGGENVVLSCLKGLAGRGDRGVLEESVEERRRQLRLRLWLIQSGGAQ